MSPNLALLFGVIFVIVAFHSDRKRDIGDTRGLFWPSIWYLVTATHPIGVWFEIWNLPLPTGGGGDATDGSLIDRFFYLGLTIMGVRVLMRRRFDWAAAFRRNPRITALLAYMAISIVWSNYPYVSFKRYIKVLGSIVMAFVVLTSDKPLESVFTVLRRTLYIHLPMSIVCTRYFRNIGVAYDWSGKDATWNGISASKNTLGQIAMLGVLYFLGEVRRHWSQFKWKNLHFAYLLMALYLLRGGPGGFSMTSLSVCVLALFIFLRIQALRQRPAAIRSFVLLVFYGLAALIILVLIHSVVLFKEDSFFGFLITKFGRDITMTGRTLIWHDVYAAAANHPLIGIGFGGFWIGRLANIPWNAHMTWVLGQGHSGYVDTYMQIGWIGSILMASLFFATVPRLIDSMQEDFDFGCFRITLFLTILYVNITESVYLRGDHPMWFVLQLSLWMTPPRRNAVVARPAAPPVKPAAAVPA